MNYRERDRPWVAQHHFTGPQRFAVETCPHCNVSKIVAAGETWEHNCQEIPHRFMWMNERAATCLGCDWNVWLPFSRSKDSAISSFNAAHAAIGTTAR